MHYFIAPMNFGLDVVRSLDVAERGELQTGISQGSSGVGLALDVVNRNRLASRYIERAVGIAEELDHPVAKGEAYLALGVHAFIAGDLDLASSYFETSQRSYREAGELRGWGVTRTLGSWAIRLRGRFEESLAQASDALRVGTDAGDDDTRGWALEEQARSLCLLGRLDEAIILCHEAVDVFRAIPAPIGVSDSLADLGICHLRRGEPAAALQALEEAYRLLEEAGATIGYSATQALWYLAEYRLQAMEGEGGPTSAADADHATRALVRNSRRVPLAAPAAGRARGTFEWLRGRHRAAERWWSKSRSDAERIGIPYQLASVEFDAGRLSHDRERVEHAIAIFADLGAELDALKASEVLTQL
jgi:tetratricopeptide (TPR) repeat protein